MAYGMQLRELAGDRTLLRRASTDAAPRGRDCCHGVGVAHARGLRATKSGLLRSSGNFKAVRLEIRGFEKRADFIVAHSKAWLPSQLRPGMGPRGLLVPWPPSPAPLQPGGLEAWRPRQVFYFRVQPASSGDSC